MLTRFAVLAFVLAAPMAAQAEVLLPSQTQAPRCADGETFDQQAQRCVPDEDRQN